MTTDQVMALLRQVMPIVGTMLTVFGLSSATANNIVNLVMTGAGPTITLAGIIWSFIANTRASIMAATATQYLVYCKANLTTAICSADNRRSVIKYVRSGRAARNQLETYVAAGNAGPAGLYNT